MAYKYLQMFLVSSFSLSPFVLNLSLRICVATFKELVACKGWKVSPPEIDLDHLRDEYNLPQGGTGTWIFREVGYKGWRESRISKLLWLCGGPGTGKTMLAKNVAAEFLKEPMHPPEGVKLVFHFVSPELPTGGNPDDEDGLLRLRLAKVACDLLYSILEQDGNLFDGCKVELEKQGDRFFTNPCSLWKVLKKAVRDCQTDPLYILIDGLDGLGGRLHGEVIERILGLMKIRTVKIFLSSRNVPHISNNLPHNPYRCIKINLDTNSFVKEDVKTFIRRRVNAWGWDDELRERSMEALLVKSEGIFLWASLAIKSLTYFSSGLDFEEFLRKPPLGLENIYQTMLYTVFSRGGSREVLNMIRCVALALRPLTFSELGFILACIEGKAGAQQRPSHRGKSGEIRRRTEREIRMYVQSSMGFLRATDTTVSIVHHTAVEYLFDENRQGDPPVLSKSEAELTISWECFRYLHHAFGDPERFQRMDVRVCHNGSPDLSSVRYNQEEGPEEALWEEVRVDPPKAAAQWPCLRYASESWFIHARRSIEISKDSFCDDSTHNWFRHQFFERSDIIRKPWIELCGDSRMEVLVGEQTPLHIAVCLGLIPLVEKALTDFPEGMNRDWLLLHLAAMFMSVAYKILIDKGGPSLLTNPDQYGNTPLHAAVIFGHFFMLQALVKTFAGNTAYSNEINKKNHSGNTPLHLAFQFDHPEIVALLIKGGADPTIRNNAQFSASELGEILERGDSLDILRRDENHWNGGSWRGGALINNQESVSQSSSVSIISSPNFHQPSLETPPLVPYNITASGEMSRSHVGDATNSPSSTYYSNNTNYPDNDIALRVNTGAVDDRSEILEWLSPLEPLIRHQDIRKRRADNLGEWRMQTSKFQNWCDGAQQEGSESGALFCPGDLGAGKTYFT